MPARPGACKGQAVDCKARPPPRPMCSSKLCAERPYDSPERFGRLTRDEWATMCHGAFLVANVGVAKPGAFARNKKGKLKTWSQCHLALGKWLRRLDDDSEKKADFLSKKCSVLAESFVNLWQAGNRAGHGEHIHEFMVDRIHGQEVSVDEAKDAAVGAEYAAALAQYLPQYAGAYGGPYAVPAVPQDIDDDDDGDQELPEGAVDWCACQYCPLAVYPGEGSLCDVCWPVGTTCACQMGDDDDEE